MAIWLHFIFLGGSLHCLASCLRPLRSKIALILVSWPTGYNRPSRNADISWELNNWTSTSRWSNYNCPAGILWVSIFISLADMSQILFSICQIWTRQSLKAFIKQNKRFQYKRIWVEKDWAEIGKEEEAKSAKLVSSNSDWAIQKNPQKTQFWWPK